MTVEGGSGFSGERNYARKREVHTCWYVSAVLGTLLFVGPQFAEYIAEGRERQEAERLKVEAELIRDREDEELWQRENHRLIVHWEVRCTREELQELLLIERRPPARKVLSQILINRRMVLGIGENDDEVAMRRRAR